MVVFFIVDNFQLSEFCFDYLFFDINYCLLISFLVVLVFFIYLVLNLIIKYFRYLNFVGYGVIINDKEDENFFI